MLSILLNSIPLQEPLLLPSLGPEKRMTLLLWQGDVGGALAVAHAHGMLNGDLVCMASGLGEAAWRAAAALFVAQEVAAGNEANEEVRELAMALQSSSSS